MKPALSAAAKEEIERIAKQKLYINGLQRTGSDNHDFHILAVWNIEEALTEAYLAGMVDHHRKG